MIKQTIGAVALGGLLATQAYAADLPSRAAPPVFVPPPLPATWTGCYVGGFGGADIARAQNNRNEATRTLATTVTPPTTVVVVNAAGLPVPTVVPGTTATTASARQSRTSYGHTSVDPDGGGRLGCNYQTGAIVYGAQLEGGYLGVNNRSSDPLSTTTFSRISGGPYVAATAKVGYAMLPQTLLYLRGGVGYADIRFQAADFTLGYSRSVRGSQVMPLAGAGLEYKLTPNVSLTGEYTYMRPGCRTSNYSYARPVTVTGVTDFNTSGIGATTSCVDKHMVSIGVNYYFNEAAPVVARY